MSSMQQIVELLDVEQIKTAILHENQSRLSVLEVLDTVDSTNSYLLRGAKTGGASGWVCLAEQQTAGRGRGARAWVSPWGANIYCSILWHFVASEVDVAGLSLAIAVIVARALKCYGVSTGIELKWPNDVLFAGRKLAGILLERLPDVDGRCRVVIGIGLNVCLPADQAHHHWIDLAEVTRQPVLRNKMAGLLINELLAQLPRYQQKGLSAFLEAWRKQDSLQGRAVVVHTELNHVTGVVQDINEQGELILQEACGKLQCFRCGEVSVRL